MRGGTLPGAGIIAVKLPFPEYSDWPDDGLCRTAVTQLSPSRRTVRHRAASDTTGQAWRIEARRARLRRARRGRPPACRAAPAVRAEAAAAAAPSAGPE